LKINQFASKFGLRLIKSSLRDYTYVRNKRGVSIGQQNGDTSTIFDMQIPINKKDVAEIRRTRDLFQSLAALAVHDGRFDDLETAKELHITFDASLPCFLGPVSRVFGLETAK